MDKKLKRCFTPHALAHSLSGLGIGFIVASLLALTGSTELWVGVVALVVGVAADYMSK